VTAERVHANTEHTYIKIEL